MQKNKPLIERVVTVTGKTLKNPSNFFVRIGTPVSNLIHATEELPKNTTMYDFVLKVIPEDIKSELSVELIDEIFQYVTSAHNSS